MFTLWLGLNAFFNKQKNLLHNGHGIVLVLAAIQGQKLFVLLPRNGEDDAG